MDEPSDSLTRRRFAEAGIATLAGIVPDRAGGDDLRSGVLRDEVVEILRSDVPDVAVTLDADPRQIRIGPLFLDNLDAQVAGPTGAEPMVPMVMDRTREGLGTPSIVVGFQTHDVLIAWTPDSEAKAVPRPDRGRLHASRSLQPQHGAFRLFRGRRTSTHPVRTLSARPLGHRSERWAWAFGKRPMPKQGPRASSGIPCSGR